MQVGYLRLGVDVSQLLAEAASRLQVELAIDGREPSGGFQKTFSKKSSAKISSENTKGKFVPSVYTLAVSEARSEDLQMNAGCFVKTFGWMDADVVEGYLLYFCDGL